MTTKHTPGPWTVETGNFHVSVRAPSRMIGDTRLIGGKPDDENLANARLWAAAPDMADEIRKQIDWLKHARAELQGVARESLLLGFDQSIKYLTTALAKATEKAT